MSTPDGLFNLLALASHLFWLVPLLPLLSAALIAILLLLPFFCSCAAALAMPASR